MSTKKRLTREERRAVIRGAATRLFAEHGYAATSIDAIARESGVTVPVVYDHFESKLALHIHLLESHYADLREVWARTLVGDDPPDVRVARAFDAWFEYVETHPYASKMLFGDTTGDPEIQKWHRAVEVQSRQFAIPFLADEPGAEHIAGADAQSMQMAWEVYRATLQGLAHWWRDNPDVPRERIVATAMNTLWLGFDRVRRGETWPLSP